MDTDDHDPISNTPEISLSEEHMKTQLVRYVVVCSLQSDPS